MRGRVDVWHEDDGRGVIDSPGMPDGCWAHFSAIDMDGYRTLTAGDLVDFTFEPAEQDGYHYRAIWVRPASVV